jgi:hypothetical protein
VSKAYDRFELLYALLEDKMDARKQSIKFVGVGPPDTNLVSKLCRYWCEQTDGRFVYVAVGEQEPEEQMVLKMKSAGAVVEQLHSQDVIDVTAMVPDVIFVGYKGQDWPSVWASIPAAVGLDTVVVLDHYYPDREDIGCKTLVKGLMVDRDWAVTIHNTKDDTPNGEVQLVEIRRARGLPAEAAAAA